MKNINKILIFGIITALHNGGCGGEKGGDHVPVDKNYVVAQLPAGTSARTIVPAEYGTNVLGRFVHVAENYRLCLAKERFTETELTEIQSFLSGKGGGVNKYGLEGLINHTFATLQAYDSNKPRFSSRVSLQVVWNDGGGCDLVISKGASAEFPFNHADFAGQKRALFDAGQITTANGTSTAIPAAYFVTGSSADEKIHIQKLAALYLGFAESQNTSSYLFSEATSGSATTWNLVDSSGSVIAGDDSLKIYSFAVAWYDVLKPQDLARFHYYEDAFAGGTVATDPLLDIASTSSTIPFKDLPGNRYLTGARKLTAGLNVCFKDDSGSGISADMVGVWTGFLKASDANGVHGKLALTDSGFNVSGTVLDSMCQLWIAFRSETQYPFVDTKANGLYAHEGRVATANNVATVIPVIYVNASNLSLSTDPILMTGARHVSVVLQHEYAHFLGFRHSADRSSLQAPAGIGTGWTEGDKAIFAEYLKYYK